MSRALWSRHPLPGYVPYETKHGGYVPGPAVVADELKRAHGRCTKGGSAPMWSRRSFPGSQSCPKGGFCDPGLHAPYHAARAATKARKPATEVGPPSAEALEVAKFAHAIGSKLLRLQHDVALRWFRPSASERERGVQGKAAPDHSAIYVSQSDHTGEFVSEVVLHELKHIELNAPMNSITRERVCREYGAKWSGAVFAAGRASDFDPGRVTLIKETHPSHASTWKARRGDVVLSRANARAWEWRDGWRELLT